jgi:hypothetical protein
MALWVITLIGQQHYQLADPGSCQMRKEGIVEHLEEVSTMIRAKNSEINFF